MSDNPSPETVRRMQQAVEGWWDVAEDQEADPAEWIADHCARVAESLREEAVTRERQRCIGIVEEFLPPGAIIYTKDLVAALAGLGESRVSETGGNDSPQVRESAEFNGEETGR
jgi:hypothetical protein